MAIRFRGARRHTRRGVQLTCSAILLCGATFAHAQPAPDAPVEDVKVKGVMPGPMRFDRPGPELELPSLGVFAMAQDRDGFMWFGTENGLVRFDGFASRVYAHDSAVPTTLSNNDVRALAVDQAGTLWVGTAGGLNKMNADQGSFQLWPPDQDADAPPGAIRTLFADAQGRLWVAHDEGLLYVDTKTGDISAPDWLADYVVTSAVQRKDGTLIFATAEGVVLLDPTTTRPRGEYRTTTTPALPADDVTVVYLDHADRLWIGTREAGLARLDGDRLVVYRNDPADPRSLSDQHVTTISSGPEDSIWIGTERGGLNRFDERTGSFVRHTASPSEADRLRDPWVTALMVSRDGVVWAATLAGLCTFDRLKMQITYYRTQGTAVMSILEDRRSPHILWFGSQAGVSTWGGLTRLDRRTGEYVTIKRLRAASGESIALDAYAILELYQDARGLLWLGTNGGGLLSYDPDDDRLTRYPVGDEGELGAVFDIEDTGKGAMWLGTWGSGLLRFDPRTGNAERFVASEAPTSLASNHLYAVTPDRTDPKILWIGAALGGLNRFDSSTGTVTRFLHKRSDVRSLSNDNVITIHQQRDGTLWLGTGGGGVNKFDPRSSTFTRYDRAGVYPPTVYGILEDRSGGLWLSSNGAGLKSMNPTTGAIVGYGARDGLQGDEFVQGGYASGADGQIYVGGVTGINAIDPARITPDTYSPPLVLTDVRVRNISRPIRSGLDLSYRDSIVAFDFAAIAYADPSRTRFEYSMDGLHSEWLVTDQHSVLYSNLEAGSYVFRVRATNRHGVRSSEEIAFPFHVSPPFWRSWWAYLVYAVLVGLAIAAAIRRQRLRMASILQSNRLATAERELALTAMVQNGFLPERPADEDERFNVVSIYEPAAQCSGDWWWYEKLSNDVRMIAVGDVTGHGPGPAMVTAAVSTTFRVMAPEAGKSSMEDVLNAANLQVLRVGQGKYMMQLLAVVVDLASGRVTFYSAAGQTALLYSPATNKVASHTVQGNPLGSAAFKIGTKEIKMVPGDRLALLTDGIPEIMQPDGRMFGLRQVVRVVTDGKEASLTGTAARLLEVARSYNAGAEQADDWTVVMAEWKPSSASRAAGPGTT